MIRSETESERMERKLSDALKSDFMKGQVCEVGRTDERGKHRESRVKNIIHESTIPIPIHFTRIYMLG
jgi:hypothetical protein